MVNHGGHLWRKHPAVRTGSALSFGERAADGLKKYFGTWSALFAVAIWIAVWMLLQKTSFAWDGAPYILLNLCLSCLAAVQGIILQISANRGDRISAEVALHTQANTDTLLGHNQQLLTINKQQLTLLQAQQQQGEILRAVAEAVKPGLLAELKQPADGRPDLRAQAPAEYPELGGDSTP